MNRRVGRRPLGLRAGAYLAASVAAPFAALAFGDPGPVLVVLPVAVGLAMGLMAWSPAEPVLRLTPSTERDVEGAPIRFQVEVEASGSVAHVALALPESAVMSDIRGARGVGRDGLVMRLDDGAASADLELTFSRWGSHVLTGSVTVPGLLRITDQTTGTEADPIVVLPETATVRRLMEPVMTNMHTGDLVSGGRGAGTEPAEVRVWQPSDPPRSINWRASARSDRLWTTERHADRNGDLVLIVDSVVERGVGMEGAVDQVVRLVVSLVEAYGRSRHRLGLVALSGYTRWFGLDTGRLHEHRLLEAVMRTQTVVEPVWMAVDRVLERTLRRPSMVVVVTPLVSGGILERVLQLAAGGIDVAVVAVDPSPWIVPPRDALRGHAHRIWRMERQRSTDLLRATGVAVGEWSPVRSVGEAIEEMDEWRRRHRRRRI